MDGYVQLGMAVIRTAFDDATKRGRTATTRRSAVAFLTDHRRVALWCALAGLDPVQVIDAGRRLSRGRAA